MCNLHQVIIICIVAGSIGCNGRTHMICDSVIVSIGPGETKSIEVFMRFRHDMANCRVDLSAEVPHGLTIEPASNRIFLDDAGDSTVRFTAIAGKNVSEGEKEIKITAKASSFKKPKHEFTVKVE